MKKFLSLLLSVMMIVSCVPAMAEDDDAAAAFIGTWVGVALFDGTDTYDIDMLGLSVTVVLHDDGTGSLVMDGDAAPGCWYVENGAAVFAPVYEEGGQPAMEEAVSMMLDEDNRMVVDLDGLYLLMEPEDAEFAGAAVSAAPAGSTEGGEMLLGEWYDDWGNKVTLTDDGKLVYTYSDGWVDEYTWAVVDGAAVVTSDVWNGLPITLENGILMITDGEGIFQIFSADGDLSAYYGEDDYYGDDGFDMPAAEPIGPEGEAYFGTWTMVMGGMAINLILNQDGTCAMEMFGEYEYAVWTVEEGVAMVMGDPLYIDGSGCLVMESMGMAFTKVGDAPAAPTAPAVPAGDFAAEDYCGTWVLESLMGMDPALLGMTMELTVNADGTCAMYDGYETETGFWTMENGVAVIDGMPLTINAEGKLVMSEDGMEMIFAMQEAMAPAEPVTPAQPEAPAAGGFTSYEDYMDIKFVATTFTSSGITMDASMLGAEYSVIFRANGTCDFAMAGMAMPNLPWGLQEVSVGLTKTDAFVINYYGMSFNCIPTETGFDLDYYGSMNLHFVPAQ